MTSAKKQKVIVTGGAGFIGSHLAQSLINDYEVTIIDNLETGSIKNIKHFLDKVRFVKGNILNLKLLKKEFVGAAYVFHQAAIPSVPKSTEFPIETHIANTTGTLNVLIASRDCKVKRVVFASSSAVYGDSPVLPKTETMSFNPLSLYATQKMTSELYAKIFHQIYGLETVGLRYFNVFGSRQDPNSKYSAVIPLFIKKIIDNDIVTINGDGKITRDFTFVSNVVLANKLASVAKNVSGEVFNIACGSAVSLNELVDMAGKILDKKPKKKYQSNRAADIMHSLADISKAEKMLGYKPLVSFEEGLKLTIESFKNKDEKSK